MRPLPANFVIGAVLVALVLGAAALSLVWTPHEASAAECACFAGAIEGMGRGWGSGMDILAEILAEIQEG